MDISFLVMVSMARSCIAVLLLSPKLGDFIAQTLILASSLLTASVANTLLSTSSVIIRSDDWILMTNSRKGASCCNLLTFFSTSRMRCCASGRME